MTAPRRVLVAARHVALDRTSEGLCTTRFVQALVDAGHEVRCLTTEPDSGVTSGSSYDITRAEPTGSHVWDAVAKITDPARAGSAIGRRSRSLAALAVQVGTGTTAGSLSEVAAWRRAFRTQRKGFAPDLVIARGGGLGFEAHLALARRRRSGPWIAHYHDPYPLSVYPPSYVERARVISNRQERASRRILRRATIVSFPSDRLARWMQRATGVDLADRQALVAHIGGGIDGDEADQEWVDRIGEGRPFLLVHTGTLLGPRSPVPLLRAFRRLIRDGPEQAAQSRLVLLGSLDRRHRSDERFLALRAELEATGNLRVEDRRTTHATAFALARSATATVVIEADDPESPFFPAKLADYLVAGPPILALAPERSVVRDLLGVGHPLCCRPNDVDAISAALDRLWHAWRDDRLDKLHPPREVRDLVTAGAAAAAVGEVVERAIRGHGEHGDPIPWFGRQGGSRRQVGSPS